MCVKITKVSRLLLLFKQSRKRNPCWIWQCMSIVSALKRQRQKDPEFKIIFSYKESSRLAWA